MKKLLTGTVLLLLGLPLILSFTASYYLKHHFLNNLTVDMEIKRFDYNHGWFNSTAQIDFELKNHPVVIQTQNNIHHGPVIWPFLPSKPFDAFTLYQIDTLFDISNLADLAPTSPNNGTASTNVSYTGKISPVINHNGLNLSIFDSQIFADLPELKSNFLPNGTITALYSGNQLEINDRYQTIYLIEPEMEFTLNPQSTFPSQLRAQASTASVNFGPQQINAMQLILTSKVNLENSSYTFSGEASTDVLNLNQAGIDQANVTLHITELDQQLAQYISANYTELVTAVNNNQWLVLLKHFSALIKSVSSHQPELRLEATGHYADLPARLIISSKLLDANQSRLNPFSLLEYLQIKLDAEIPIQLINEINQPGLTDLINLMKEKGLLISKDESYYSKLNFEDAKIKIAHTLQ